MSNLQSIILEQKELCRKYQADFVHSSNDDKLGISLNVKGNKLPINGLRLYPDKGTSGWFIWAGEELSQDPDFFVPLHIEHVEEWVPNIIKFLGLAPGWRFLVAENYEDVWYDQEILNG
ncbi:immunity protein Imm33 domain-containing protein [Paenibacillus prosopidis]|uniref:Imm33-like domain-containing protein n=1 Tax=Paenibacillus prosopidis TaxID=630520 RepID=A0A368VKV9_9BACL|nr:hypothetical protein [Paenibacillus prosopidis]RCW41263.1 hypothetical protein DFP97_1252 [Paenibacillus prosopidis]